jgi:methylsterol monooxygenase
MLAAPPDTPLPYDGKNHQWALDPAPRLNGKVISLLPTVSILAFSCWFNRTDYARELYTSLNESYTPWEINVYGGFLITSVVYWIGGFIFMAADLWDPLHNLVKRYKVQPGKRVSAQDYKRVCWVVLRNQVLVALPLLVAVSTFRPPSTSAQLPGTWATIGVYFFSMACEEAGFFYVVSFFPHLST